MDREKFYVHTDRSIEGNWVYIEDTNYYLKVEDSYYKLMDVEDELYLSNDRIEKRPALSVRVDLETTSVRGSQYRKFKTFVNEERSLQETQRVFEHLARKLRSQVNSIRNRSTVRRKFTTTNNGKIVIENFTPKNNRLNAYIDGVKHVITEEEDGLFQITPTYNGSSKEIRIENLTNNERREYRRMRQWYNLFLPPMNRENAIYKLHRVLAGMKQESEVEEFGEHTFLNEKQVQAINSVLTDDLTIVEGLAGTGKTTSILIALDELASRRLSVLVVTHPHKALDRIIMGLNDKSEVIRYATNNTKNKVTKEVQQYLSTNKANAIKKRVQEELDQAIRDQQDIKIKNLQMRTLDLFKKDIANTLITLSNRLHFSTADGLFSVINELGDYEINVEDYQEQLPIFDVVIAEDSSDINFPSVLFTAQYAKKWVITGDLNQSKPIGLSPLSIPDYRNMEFPREDERVTPLDDLREGEKRSKSLYNSHRNDLQILHTPAIEVLKSSFEDRNTEELTFKTLYRYTREYAEALAQIFERQFTNADTSQLKSNNLRFLGSPVKVVDTTSKGMKETKIQKDNGDETYRNDFEANKVVEYLDKFKGDLSIAVSSMYTGQVEHITSKLKKKGYTEQGDGSLKHPSSGISATVHTHRNFKNTDHDYMFFSATRTGRQGILSNTNELFTVFTRAKRGIVLFCNYGNFKKQKSKKNLWFKISKLKGVEVV